MKNIYKFLFVVSVCFIFSTGCKYIAPSTSKAITEEKQLEESKEQTEQMKEQNIQLKRIADALEKIIPKH